MEPEVVLKELIHIAELLLANYDFELILQKIKLQIKATEFCILFLKVSYNLPYGRVCSKTDLNNETYKGNDKRARYLSTTTIDILIPP
ncbi:Hypothetical predicted protein [Octopus vulgaris]|uniref:Uncharacterized protein n=1 Tax=Octopus vulgaris TaxID=6645 RepID=A0AA36AKM0_OCTVU|nr:Hypothetical predicted protein [Octopus vulgaris]